jgi:hypothetical protein
MNVKQSLIAGALALAASAATLVVGFAPAASASCASRDLTTGYRGPGSTTTKPTGTTCHDLNLTKADDTSYFNDDWYAGFLYHSSTGTWQICDSGYHFTADFTASSSSQWIVLCTDILAGTRVGVGSWFDAPDNVRIAF